MSRRTVFRRGGKLVAGAWLAGDLSSPTVVTAQPSDEHPPIVNGPERTVELHESSSLGVALSPDGRTIAMDALNVLWVMPVEGGPARRLTEDIQEATQPCWSPDGRRLVFQSYCEGAYDIWMINADGSGLRRLTEGPGYDESPRFSPDGKLIAFSSDRGNASQIWLLEVITGALRVIPNEDKRHSMPTFTSDGRVVYIAGDTAVESFDPATGEVGQLATAAPGAKLYGVSVSPDGRHLAYVSLAGAIAELYVDGKAVTSGEDVTPLTSSWFSADEILYTAAGRIRRRKLSGTMRDIPFSVTTSVVLRTQRHRAQDYVTPRSRDVRGIAGPVLSPDASQVAFRAMNALWLLPIGGKPQRIVADGYFNTDPDWSPDGRSLVYVSDRAGTANLWRYELATGESTRLTDLPNGQLRPRWSPEGNRIAYQDQTDATWVLDVAANAVRQVLPPLYQPGRPGWSPDGNVVAIAAIRPYSKRWPEGHNQIASVNLATDEIRYQPPAPERSVSTRGDDGPIWTNDGHVIVSMESLAWRIPVEATGGIVGAPARLTDEVTDSLSVSADGKYLLYLHNGTLRLLDMDSGCLRTVPIGLSWSPSRPPERVVVRAGALWDGSGTEYRRNVDIVVEDGRIAAVLPAGAATGKIVDATRLTVLPGLIDTHNHWWWRGKQWGDRQGRTWLAYGVTTSRSPADPAYQMVENRESLNSGARVGPRHYGTGEALEGSRTYHYVMRPTFTADQMRRELDRAQGLGYDIFKSYVTLPQSFERMAVEWAHSRGVPVTSHYLYPAVRTGLEGMEHTGGGNRLTYSRTLSLGLGLTSSDSVELLVRSGMWISTTTLFAMELYKDDRSLIEDERTKVLFPPWEYQKLLQKAKDAADGPNAALYHAWTLGDVDMLLKVQRAGGFVVCGTDAALDDIGLSMHSNLRVMVKYGFTPREALTTATVNAAKCLGLGDQLGEILPGRLADMIMVDGDPLRNIHDTAAVRLVMVGGLVRNVPDLLAPFRGPVSSVGNNDVLPAAPSAAHNPAHYWHVSASDVSTCCRPVASRRS